jgi:aspartate dehydrogenase
MRSLDVTLIGYGAIGHTLHQRAANLSDVRITHIVVTPSRVQALQEQLGSGVIVTDRVPERTPLVLECAGHSALTAHVLPALQRGIECAVLSIGAFSEAGLPERLQAAAEQGGTQLHLLAGAIGGIDALSAARLAGLDSVVYTGRKPPAGWRGSPAEQVVDLETLREPAVILQASAREAARLYPKNANVAATVSLAGLGLDRTEVRLIADPGVSENIHEIQAQGAFGQMHLQMRGKPLAENPKTSALTVLSALRFLHNRVAALTL